MLRRETVWLFAAASGLTVANVYWCQPLLGEISASFEVSERAAGSVAIVAQLGYAAGIALFVPLGDTSKGRRLVLSLMTATAAALGLAAVAPSFGWLCVACGLVGVLTPVPQLLIPLAARLAPQARRGRIVGTVQGGLLVGIVFARVVSGGLASWLGWRTSFAVAATLTLATAGALARVLPADAPASSLPYGRLLRSLPGLLRSEPLLRTSCLSAAAAGVCFSVFWTPLPFVAAAAPFDFGVGAIGLLGALGLASALAAPSFGRVADRFGSHRSALLAGAVIALAFVVLTERSLASLLLGIVLLDVGAQANQVANQSALLAVSSPESNRRNAVYMVCRFAGMSGGSLLGIWAWTASGWSAVCLLGLAASVVVLIVHARRT